MLLVVALGILYVAFAYVDIALSLSSGCLACLHFLMMSMVGGTCLRGLVLV